MRGSLGSVAPDAAPWLSAARIDQAVRRLGGRPGRRLFPRFGAHRLWPGELPARLPQTRGCRFHHGRPCPPGVLGHRGSLDVLGAVDGFSRVAASRWLVCLRGADRRVVRSGLLLGLPRHPSYQRSGRTDIATGSRDFTSCRHAVGVTAASRRQARPASGQSHPGLARPPAPTGTCRPRKETPCGCITGMPVEDDLGGPRRRRGEDHDRYRQQELRPARRDPDA